MYRSNLTMHRYAITFTSQLSKINTNIIQLLWPTTRTLKQKRLIGKIVKCKNPSRTRKINSSQDKEQSIFPSISTSNNLEGCIPSGRNTLVPHKNPFYYIHYPQKYPITQLQNPSSKKLVHSLAIFFFVTWRTLLKSAYPKEKLFPFQKNYNDTKISKKSLGQHRKRINCSKRTNHPRNAISTADTQASNAQTNNEAPQTPSLNKTATNTRQTN